LGGGHGGEPAEWMGLGGALGLGRRGGPTSIPAPRIGASMISAGSGGNGWFTQLGGFQFSHSSGVAMFLRGTFETWGGRSFRGAPHADGRGAGPHDLGGGARTNSPPTISQARVPGRAGLISLWGFRGWVMEFHNPGGGQQHSLRPWGTPRLGNSAPALGAANHQTLAPDEHGVGHLHLQSSTGLFYEKNDVKFGEPKATNPPNRLFSGGRAWGGGPGFVTLVSPGLTG